MTTVQLTRGRITAVRKPFSARGPCSLVGNFQGAACQRKLGLPPSGEAINNMAGQLKLAQIDQPPLPSFHFHLKTGALPGHLFIVHCSTRSLNNIDSLVPWLWCHLLLISLSSILLFLMGTNHHWVQVRVGSPVD